MAKKLNLDKMIDDLKGKDRHTHENTPYESHR